MKILVVGSLPASLRNFRGALIEELCARGHCVHVAAPGLLQDEPTCVWLSERTIICHDIAMVRTGLSPLEDLKTLFCLFKLFRRVRPDVVLGYTIKPVIWGGLASWLAGVPTRVSLITGLGYAFTGEAKGRRALVRALVSRLYAMSLRHSTLVAFQNPDDLQDFRSLGILRSDTKTTVLNGSGVDIAQFAPVPFPDGPLRFLLIARLLGDKGIREYAVAAQRLRQNGVAAEFHLVGPLDSNPDGLPKELVESWHQSGCLRWHGAVSDVRPAISDAHVYVLPSCYREGTPRTVLEAMSMGRPIITTDAPGCRQTVEPGGNGFLVPVRDASALADAMMRFVEDLTLVARMGSRSRQIVEEKYDVRKVNAAMIEAMGC